MPRSNIPFRPKRYFSNRKRTSFSRAHVRSTADGDLVSDQQAHVNNIVFFPKYSETTINLLGSNSKILPYGNILKRIKGRKRKEKQRLKKKQIIEGDVKPFIKKVKPSKSGKMQPKLNQHIIFLSDSEGEDQGIHSSSISEATQNVTGQNEDNDDDVIYVETPAPEIIEIEDSIEPNETPVLMDNSNERVSSPDDFLDNAHVNLKSKFDIEPESSEFKQTEFVKPSSAPIDMSESGSISSVSDVSTPLPMNVFKLIDFPQEKNNLFDDENLDKFRDAITPRRNNKKQEELGENDNLPLLSEIQAETSNRKERGRSIIKELVNDRAYVLLSTQKKSKKKRKSKDESTEYQEEGNNDSEDANKKKKKKKSKRKESCEDENDFNDLEKNRKQKNVDDNEITDSSVGLMDASISKKFKKNKTKDSEISISDDNSETKKKKCKRNLCEIIDENKQSRITDNSEDIYEKKKKKVKKNPENDTTVEVDVQENQEEKKRKKNRRNHEISVNEENDGNSQIIPEENEERKKKKIKRISESSLSFNDTDGEKQTLNIETTDERKKKKSKNITDTTKEKEDVIEKEIRSVQNIEELEVSEQIIEERRKKKNKKIEETHLDSEKEIVQQKEVENEPDNSQVKIDKEVTFTEKLQQNKESHIEKEKLTDPELQENESSVLSIPEKAIINEEIPDFAKLPGETENMEKIDKKLIETEIIEDVKAENETSIENELERDDNFECNKKRKKSSSISETFISSKETKRRRLSMENTDHIIAPPDAIELSKSNENLIEELRNQNQENNAVEEDIVLCNVEDELKITKENIKSENEFIEIPVPHSVDPMVVVDNEGNIDMKLTSVFTPNTSIFPEENNFSNDLNVCNFFDNNPAWNANPIRFCSYNVSLFNKTTGEGSPVVISEDQRVESTEVHTAEVIDGENVSVPIEETLNESTLVKKENIVDECSEKEEIVVKNEVDEVETNDPDQLPAMDVIETPPVGELPNDIEEIVREKDNLDTVKRLCEFLEEVKYPEDVLKKVSLLKQAFTEKSQSVEISQDEDDVLSISSTGSSVICCEDVPVLNIDHDITLANCDVTQITENRIGTSFPPLAIGSIEKVGSDNVVEIVTSENVQGTPRKSGCEVAQITPEYVGRSESIPGTSRTKDQHKGLDKYEVEDIQNLMSDNPRLWRISAEDIHPIRLPSRGKRCIKCREIGHLGYNCPNKLKLPKCSLCGMEGHLDFKCPNRICIQCGRRSAMMQNCCEHCKHYRNLTCAMCKNKGHPKNKCPDMWRRYHLTVNHGPLVKGSTLKTKDKQYLWCSSCAKSGHSEYECTYSLLKCRNFQSLDPRIHFYEDVYKVPPLDHNQDFIQPNLDEVPQSSTNLLPESDSSSTSSSSSNDSPNDPQEVPPNDPQEVPTNNPQEVPPNDTSILSQSLNDGLQNLLPGFEVIDEVNDEKEELKLNVGNAEVNKFFMGESLKSVLDFLTKELTILETSKFEIKNIHPRFFAFVEDDKLPEHKRRFNPRNKEKFFKSLNMLLFGKLQVKCGRVHLDKLKRFIKFPPSSLPTGVRESLCYSYDYIFRNFPHEHVNYKFFLKMIRNKYGNQKWIF